MYPSWRTGTLEFRWLNSKGEKVNILRNQRGLPRVRIASSHDRIPLHKCQGSGVHTVSKVGRRRPVIEDVPEMSPAASTEHLGPGHSITRILGSPDIYRCNRSGIAGPSGSRLELVPGIKEIGPATGASVDSVLMGVVIRARERRFCPLQPGNIEGLWGKNRLPFLFSSDNRLNKFHPAGGGRINWNLFGQNIAS